MLVRNCLLRRILIVLNKLVIGGWFIKLAKIGRSNLSSIADEIWLDIVRGDLETAVFKSFRAVEIAVRKAGHFAGTDIGVPLMRKAFDKVVGSLSDSQQPEAEREALAHFFAGTIGSYKNTHSHRTITINDAIEAQEMVVLASHLLRIVDSRR